MKLPAPAKINLFLNIVGRRPDGYHELQTLFQLLDFGDELSFSPAEELSVACPGIDVPEEDNLVYRAARTLADFAGVNAGARIRVTKRIPDGGGLGGGSSDAATTLHGLNRLWGVGASVDDLARLGLALGADVPVFVRGRTAWAEGVGEQLEPVDLPEKWYVVLHPGVTVPTGAIFGHEDLTRNGSPITIARFLRQGAVNACESVVYKCYPAVEEAARWLGRMSESDGPASMTGTGACVFVPVDTEEKARAIVEAVPEKWSSFAAKGINLSPLLADKG